MRQALRDSIAKAQAANGKEGRDFLNQILIGPEGEARDAAVKEYAEALADKNLVEKGYFTLDKNTDVADLSVLEMFAENPDIVYVLEAPDKKWNADTLADRALYGMMIRDAVIVVTGTQENVDKLFADYPQLRGYMSAPVDLGKPPSAEDIAGDREERRAQIAEQMKDITFAPAADLDAPAAATFRSKTKEPQL